MRRLAAILGLGGAVAAQSWPEPIQEVRIESSADGTKQPALFFAPASREAVPLLVGLHTWSAGYRQKMSVPYAKWCVDEGWAFVHPDFRGPNRNRSATGSDLAVQDIVDAVAFAKRRAKIDPDRVYLIGTSGGGHMALLMAGLHPRLWAGVSAWVPISDLAAWHRQCRTAKRRYWKDLEMSCGGAPSASEAVDVEYERRSPLTWLDAAVGVNVDIHAGIRDGHAGSVPVSQALRAFNVLARQKDRFRADDIRRLTARPVVPSGWPRPEPDPDYGKKHPLVRRSSGKARVTLFDGGHEGIPRVGLAWLARQRRQLRIEDEPWKMHVIDGATKTRRGADGVRLGDANGDGRLDIVTGWEEGQVIRVCLNPGPKRAKQPWPAVTVGQVRSAEDAVFADLDGDGNLDVVSCTEGRDKTIYVHWAPAREAILKPEAWQTTAVPVTAKRQAWMFALPMDIDGEHGIDLVVGAKGKGATVGWLQSPKQPRDVEKWQFHEIVDAGWIMSLRAGQQKGLAGDVLVTDRKGKDRGIYRLRSAHRGGVVEWKREAIGGSDREVMFLDSDSTGRPLVATRNGVILDFRGAKPATIPNPYAIRFGKAVHLADLDHDGEPDIVHTANTGQEPHKPGVCWLQRSNSTWHPHNISGTRGTKFDRIETLDLDGDGDLDVLTCEENAGPNSRGLGVIWYENPTR